MKTTTDLPGACVDGDAINWSFAGSATANKWCTGLSSKMSLTDPATGNSWTSSAVTTDADLGTDALNPGFTVLQTSAFSATTLNAVATFTSDSGSSTTDLTFDFSVPSSCCMNTMSTFFTFESDSLSHVVVSQEVHDMHSTICGTPTYTLFDEQAQQVALLSSGVTTHVWEGRNSATGSMTYKASVTYSNFPGVSDFTNAETSVQATNPWTQGCSMALPVVKIDSFTMADYDTSASATAIVTAQATMAGDCGGAPFMSGTLEQIADGKVTKTFTVPLTMDMVSEDGQRVTVDIPRDAAQYQFKVTFSAVGAQSPEDHQAMTTGTGFANIIDVAGESQKVYSKDVTCNIADAEIAFTDYKEQSDWSGPMLAGFTGSFYAENSCTTPQCSITLMDGNNASAGNVSLADGAGLTQDGRTYSFNETWVSAANLHDTYWGVLSCMDMDHPSESESVKATPEEWQPPCYLDITTLQTTGQSDSLDWLRTTIDFEIHVERHGDDACTDTTATFQLMNADGDATFTTGVSGQDMDAATDGVFKFQVAVGSDEAVSATATLTDPNAAEDATKSITNVHTTPDSPDCSIDVRDFCLTDARASDTAGRWEFDFTIRVESNQECGALSASLDIISDTHFLGNVSVDGDEIASAFDCECDKVVTVIADFDGSASTIYGQLEIHNGESELAQLTDSCTFDLTA